jgi:hypothetical protein
MPCKLCGASGTNIRTCPFNPNALSPNPQKHKSRALTQLPQKTQKTQKTQRAQKLQKKEQPKPKPTKVVAIDSDYLLDIPPVYQAPKLPRGQVGVQTEQWKLVKPSTKQERQDLSDLCGDKCFLIPELQKYPVCDKGNTCDFSCPGIRAQRNITHLTVNKPDVSREAKMRAIRARSHANELGAKHCGWVKK